MAKSESSTEAQPAQPRIVYYVPTDAYVEGKGFRASLVVEGEAGHHPTGTWPYSGKVGESMPYFWGHDYSKACESADVQNARLGVDKATASKIVADSIHAQISTRKRRGRRS